MNIIDDTSSSNFKNKLEDTKNYWLKKLSGELIGIRIPYDFTEIGEYNEARFQFSLGEEITQKALFRSNNNELSLFVLLMTGYKILISKFSAHEDITVSSSTYNFHGDDYNKFILFRDNIEMQGTFKDALLEINKSITEGYQNQYYPLNELESLLNTEYLTPLFKIALFSESIHKVEYIKEIQEIYNPDIIFAFNDTRENIGINVIYNSNLYEEESIQRISEGYVQLLKQGLSDLNIKLSEIDLLNDDEKQFYLNQISVNCTEYPKDKTLSLLFEEQVKKTPENIALSIDNNDYTYKELNQKANQLARMLKANCNIQNEIVGIMMDSSLQMVISIIGILKAGGAYLPIDPKCPLERLKYMIDNSQVKVLLTQDNLLDKNILQTVCSTVIMFDSITKLTYDNSNLNIKQKPDSLACVIYTSGTTGEPKGVGVEHRGIINYTYWRLNTYNYTFNDITLQLLSYCFDGFNSNFYSSLLSGGTLILIAESKKIDYYHIVQTIKEKSVTNVSLVPGIYDAILDAAEIEDIKSLRFVVLAGEKTTQNIVKKSHRKNSNILLINEYGPTETTVTVAANIGMNEHNVSEIGKPIANTQLYIVDSNDKLLPFGAIGELAISGVGMSKGYLNNPNLNSEVFITNPFALDHKLYKSGDYARLLNNGNIEISGRIDHQVKLNGFRIELKEIEFQLLNHIDIVEAIVIMNKDEGGNDFLCAYFVAKRELTLIEVKKFLLDKLLYYMIPKYFIQLDKIPLNANGKVNINELKKNLSVSILSIVDNIAPKTKTELIIAEIWEELLMKNSIGVHSNFFDIGGNSFKVHQLLGKLNHVFNKEISITRLFKYPTIYSFANYIDSEEELAIEDRSEEINKGKDDRLKRFQKRNQ